jgi:MATE family multidrug resistance protein
VHFLNLGIYGTGLADLTTFSFRLILFIIFTRREKDMEKTLVWPDKRIFQDLIGYIKIGAPSTFMVCLDWWAWELNLFFSGYFGVT